MCRHFEVRCSSVFQKEPGNQCNQNIVEDGEEGETRGQRSKQKQD